MKAYWMQLQARERRLLLLGALALLLLLAYALVWEPARAGLARLEQDTAAQRATLAWMEQARQQVQHLRQTRPPTGGPSLLPLAEQSAKAHGLGPALKRIQPDGQHSVRVWLEQASFDDTLRWLDTLAGRHGVKIGAFSAERADAGRVHARLVLEAPE